LQRLPITSALLIGEMPELTTSVATRTWPSCNLTTLRASHCWRAQAQTAKLMIFGGSGHRVYLGCLNCSEYASDSVKNAYGTHGSAYSSESIFNHYSEYGSPYSSESACSEYASDPPVIVDETGRYYGRLTLNRYHAEIGAGTQFMGWLAAVCQN
jgi:hypothetical protein